MLPDLHQPRPPKAGSLAARWNGFRAGLADRFPAFAGVLAPKVHDGHEHDPYQSAFYQRFRKLLDACLRHRWLVIGITVLAFVLSIVDVPLRAAAVLPRFDPAGTDGRHGAGRRFLAAFHPGPGRETGEAAGRAHRHRQLRRLRRHRFAAVLPAAGPAAAASQLRPVRGHRQGPAGARGLAPLDDRRGRPAVPAAAVPRHPPGERPAGRLPDPVPRRRRAHRPGPGAGQAGRRAGARQSRRHQRQPGLGRTQQGRAPGHRPGPRARAGREHRGRLALPHQFAVGLARQYLSRGQRADRDPAARSRRGARAPGHARQPGGAHASAAACRCRRSPTSNTRSRTASSGIATACPRSPCAPTSATA